MSTLVSEHIADIPSYIFGPYSTLVATPSPQEALVAGQGLALWFVAALLVTAISYLLWLSYWGARSSNHKLLFRFLGSHRGGYGVKLEMLGPSFRGYTNYGSTISFLSIWVALIVYFDVYSILFYKLAAVVLIGVIAIYLYQFLLVKLLGIVVNCRDFTKAILNLRGVLYTIVAIVTTPMVLCYALTDNNQQEVFKYILIFQVISVLLLFIYESFLLFMAKKVSVLHTILYLCTVEIFPITLIWGFFNR